MKKYYILLVLLLPNLIFSQNIPYNLTPDWESNANGHRATGLGIADINGDGWKDLVVANGNDMARQSLVVYYNNGDGTFPADPDWESGDIDYHGHLACGDLNKDGAVDVLVSVYLGPTGWGDPGYVKVYYNTGTELETNPSFKSDPFFSFSCTLGDVNASGYLDIIAACGEPYSSLYDHGRIFYNQKGSFQQSANWMSSIAMGALDVECGDFDMNGYTDVLFACEETNNVIYLADNTGNIDNTPDWQSADSDNYMNSVDIGFINSSTYCPSAVMTGNDQLGGDGRIRLYDYFVKMPLTSPADWQSNPVGYGSGILLSDVTNDGILDLIYGGWWLPMEILKGTGTYFESDPSYSSTTTSVVETILISDLRKRNIKTMQENFSISTPVSFFYLENQNVEAITSVYINGSLAPLSKYSHVPGKNWIAFYDYFNVGDDVTVNYEYTYDGDIVISNWDSNKGNFIYYNQNPVGTEERNSSSALRLKILANPSNGNFAVAFDSDEMNIGELKILDVSGRLLYYKSVEMAKGSNKYDLSLSLSSGLYTLVLEKNDGIAYTKVIIK